MATIAEIENLVNKIIFLENNLRILSAREEYNKLQSIIQSDSLEPSIKQEIQTLLNKNQKIFDRITQRSDEINHIIQDTSDSLDGWVLGSEMFGISTYYRIEDDGYLSLRMEGVQEIPIFEQLAVLYEVALFNQWMPFCNQSDLLKQICKYSFFCFCFCFFWWLICCLFVC